MKKKAKRAIVKVETKLAKPRTSLAKSKPARTNQQDLADAEAYRDHALQNLKDAVLLYAAAEAACAGAYLELLSAGNALGHRR